MNKLMDTKERPLRLVMINAGISNPSTTRMLAERTAQKSLERMTATGVDATLSVIDLAPLAADIARAIVAGFPSAEVQSAIDTLAGADAIIAATPVYKAGISGLFKSFIDVLDNDLIIAKPVVLAATAGTARHAMIPDEQMRPLFAFLRTVPVPTSLFAAPEDWNAPELTSRIERAAVELTQFVTSGVGHAITDAAWKNYQHQFAGNATQAERTAQDVNFDTDLMRLAAGGTLSKD